MTTETPTDLEALAKEVRKRKRVAADAAMALHDVAEECPARWREIPAKAEEAYARHTAYFEAKERLEALEAAGS